MNNAFFLDRDGTINVDYNYVHTPEEWTWCDGAIDALRWINSQGLKIIIVTNQSGIARDRYTEQHVQDLHSWADDKLATMDIKIDEWLYAPHHPEHDPDEQFEPSDRKPGTGMFEKAAAKHNINFKNSYMAGDKITDLKPAVELGITPFFIRSRHEPNQEKAWLDQHDIPSFENIGKVTQQLATQNN
jgi:D-glycero-D-manno-heptose 1,7-bisphosphate phosphatase